MLAIRFNALLCYPFVFLFKIYFLDKRFRKVRDIITVEESKTSHLYIIDNNSWPQVANDFQNVSNFSFVVESKIQNFTHLSIEGCFLLTDQFECYLSQIITGKF